MHISEDRLLRRRMCAPVPFEGTLLLEDAMRDFELHVSGFDSYALYAPGLRPGIRMRYCMLGCTSVLDISCHLCQLRWMRLFERSDCLLCNAQQSNVWNTSSTHHYS